MILFDHLLFKTTFFNILIKNYYIFKQNYLIMAKRTLSNKSRVSILRLSGFRARMATTTGRKTIKNRRKKGRKKLALNH